MAFGLLFIIVWSVYICLIAVVLFCCHRFFKLGLLGKCLVGIILLMIPFWRGILIHTLMFNYKIHNSPLQQINRTVEKPESVFWFDEVWPGFDDYGQRMMIENYLDGVHLKKLALNDGMGNVNVYQAVADDLVLSKKIYLTWQKSKKKEEEQLQYINSLGLDYNAKEKLLKEKNSEYYKLHKLLKEQRVGGGRLFKLYKEQLKKDISQIIRRAQSYRLSEFLSQHAHEFDYKVNIHRQHLPEWQEKYIWADKITIFDVHKNEVIGYSKRCLRINTTKFWFWDIKYLIAHFVKYSEGIGDYRVYQFDDKVLFEHTDKMRNGYDLNRRHNFNPKAN